jgi:phospholipid transport system substrate-binding protein
MGRALALSCLMLLAVEGRGRAGAATDQVKATVDQVVRILEDPGLRGPAHMVERRTRIREVVLQRFGFEEMAKRSLGPTWLQLSTGERKDFVHLFTELLERSYISRVERYKGQPITYGAESQEGELAEVRSTIPEPLGEPTRIVYRLIHSDGSWQVYDLVIDGVSLVNNYRVQFAQIIRASSYKDLVGKMRSKLASEEETERAPPERP